MEAPKEAVREPLKLTENSFLQGVVDAYSYEAAPIVLAFGYGSGVKKQVGNESEDNMTDFMFVVEDPEAWHEANLKAHGSDYSEHGKNASVRKTWAQEGVGMWYHTHIDFQGKKIKYGVISVEDYKRDCEQWDSVYMAGRLHKPVEIITPNGALVSDDLAEAYHTNLDNALKLGILLLPQTFSQTELYASIAGISYSGDPRVKHGADSVNKAQNIANGSPAGFEKLYRKRLQRLVDEGFLAIGGGGYARVEGGKWDNLVNELVQNLNIDNAVDLEFLRKGTGFENLEKLTPVPFSVLATSIAVNIVVGSLSGRIAKSSRQQVTQALFSTSDASTRLYMEDKARKSKPGLKGDVARKIMEEIATFVGQIEEPEALSEFLATRGLKAGLTKIASLYVRQKVSEVIHKTRFELGIKDGSVVTPLLQSVL